MPTYNNKSGTVCVGVYRPRVRSWNV